MPIEKDSNYLKADMPEYEITHICVGCVERDKRIADLEQELAKYKLKWQTGKPPIEGQGRLFHGRRRNRNVRETFYAVLDGDYFIPTYDMDGSYHYTEMEWAGPILQPEDPDRDHSDNKRQMGAK